MAYAVSQARAQTMTASSTLNPAAVQHPDKVHPSGIESVKGQRSDFLGHGKKQLQARKFEFLSDAKCGVLHGYSFAQMHIYDLAVFLQKQLSHFICNLATRA